MEFECFCPEDAWRCDCDRDPRNLDALFPPDRPWLVEATQDGECWEVEERYGVEGDAIDQAGRLCAAEDHDLTRIRVRNCYQARPTTELSVPLFRAVARMFEAVK